MSDFEEITTVPPGFRPMPPQRVGAGTWEAPSNSTRQILQVFASVGGLAVQIENPRSLTGGMVDFRVTHSVPSRPGSRFVHNETVIEKKWFAQGEKIMFLDTSHASLKNGLTFYCYEFTIETTQGNKAFGDDLGLNVSLFQAPPVLKQDVHTRHNLITESDVLAK
jgi:hypothetical protein